MQKSFPGAGDEPQDPSLAVSVDWCRDLVDFGCLFCKLVKDGKGMVVAEKPSSQQSQCGSMRVPVVFIGRSKCFLLYYALLFLRINLQGQKVWAQAVWLWSGILEASLEHAWISRY